MENCQEHSGVCEKTENIEKRVDAMEKKMDKLIEDINKSAMSFKNWIIGILVTLVFNFIGIISILIFKK